MWRILTLSRIEHWHIILHIQEREVIWYSSKKHGRPSIYLPVGLYTEGYRGDERLSSLSNAGSSAPSWFSAHLLLLSSLYFTLQFSLWEDELTQSTQNLNPIWANNIYLACYVVVVILFDRVGVSVFNKCKKDAFGLKTCVFRLNREAANALMFSECSFWQQGKVYVKGHLHRGNKPLSMVAVTKPGSGYTHKLWRRKREMIPFVCWRCGGVAQRVANWIRY